MKQILIATHGKMASGILYTAEMILGKQENITAMNAYVDADIDVEKEFDTYFQERKGQRIIVMTDLEGGSVNQKLMQYAAKDERITLITGINLPLLIQILFAEGEVREEEIQSFIENARKELKISGIPKMADKENEENKAKKEIENPDSDDDSTDHEHSEAIISALRIDDRLIHGQVAMTWTKQLKVQGIIVANDDAARDNTQKMALKMAVPTGIKVLVKPVKEAIRILNYPKASTMRILVLTRTIQDALNIRKNVKEIEFLNLGNTGRFDGIDVAEKTMITPTIMLTKEELKAAEELVKLDEKFCMQQVPNDEQKLVKEVLAKL